MIDLKVTCINTIINYCVFTITARYSQCDLLYIYCWFCLQCLWWSVYWTSPCDSLYICWFCLQCLWWSVYWTSCDSLYIYGWFLFAVPVTVNEEVDDISVRKVVHNEQLSLVEEAYLHSQASITSTASSSYSASDDGSSMVVNMRNKLQFHKNVRIRQPGLTDTDVGINLRVGHSTCKVDDDLTDLQIVGEFEEPTEKPKGYVLQGGVGGGAFTFLPHYFKIKLQIYDGMVHGCNQIQYTQSQDFSVGPSVGIIRTKTEWIMEGRSKILCLCVFIGYRHKLGVV